MNASHGKKVLSTASAPSRAQPEIGGRVQPKAQARAQPQARPRSQPREQRLLHGGYWLLATAVFSADQGSKIAAQDRLSEGPIEILPMLNFSLVYNRGAAFGIFSGGQMAALLLAVSMIAVVVFAILLHRESRALPCLSWSLMLGGALGNGLDRVLFNRVTDFIDFHLSGQHFPAFNIADASLTFGVLLMILAWHWQSGEKPAAKEPPPSSSRRKKEAPPKAATAVSEAAPQAGKKKKSIDQGQAPEAEGRSQAQAQSGAGLTPTPAEPPVGLPAESQPPATEAAQAPTSAVEASEDRQAASAPAAATAAAPFAPLAEANLSQAFAAKPYSAGSQRQGKLSSRR